MADTAFAEQLKAQEASLEALEEAYRSSRQAIERAQNRLFQIQRRLEGELLHSHERMSQLLRHFEADGTLIQQLNQTYTSYSQQTFAQYKLEMRQLERQSEEERAAYQKAKSQQEEKISLIRRALDEDSPA
ncbi:hypothetical protein AB3331_11265 [Streptococcus sp. H49]|uniref:hypothetical protein n=1 Tax=Streptococcus huangxiaojuni TaxID=3237239 RepID=UPI0034A57A99